MYAEQLTSLGASIDATLEAQALALSNAETERDIAQREAAAAAEKVTTLTGSLAQQTAATADARTALTACQSARLTLEQRVRDLEAQLASAGAVPAGWKVAFEDTFAGTSVDRSKWNVRDNTTQNNMDGRNWAKNAIVKDGVLSFSSGAPGADGKWPCGYLDTIGKFSFQYGRVEARMRHPWGADATGFWGAFWLRPDDGGDGEIDVMEAWPAKGEIGPTLHNDYRTGATHIPHRGYRIPVTGWNPEDWHVYALDWEKGSLRFLLDDKVIWAPTTAQLPWLTVFDRPVKWNLRLNLQMGGSWGGKPTAATNLAQTFDLDYVRVLTKT
jgi:beta-glucanase (GH16 family)